MIYELTAKTSIADQYLIQLRDTHLQQDRARFRKNLERIGILLGYEMSRHLDYIDVEVETTLGLAPCRQLADELVLIPILRGGLPVHTGLLSVFDDAEHGFVASYRRHHKDSSFEVAMEYSTYPDIDGKVLVLADAMIATGSSVIQALEALLEDQSAKAVHIVTTIAATQGIDLLQRRYPDAHLWIGAIDDELTAKSYIVPGLGDAGDLAFGPKRQD